MTYPPVCVGLLNPWPWETAAAVLRTVFLLFFFYGGRPVKSFPPVWTTVILLVQSFYVSVLFLLLSVYTCTYVCVPYVVMENLCLYFICFVFVFLKKGRRFNLLPENFRRKDLKRRGGKWGERRQRNLMSPKTWAFTSIFSHTDPREPRQMASKLTFVAADTDLLSAPT